LDGTATKRTKVDLPLFETVPPFGIGRKENDKRRDDDNHPQNPNPLLMPAKASKHNDFFLQIERAT